MASMDSTQASTTAARRLPTGTSGAILAILALVFATVALTLRDGGDGGGNGVTAGDAVSVALSEFAIEPAALEVPQGGSLAVTNTGSADHDLTVRGTDLTTGTLGAGETTTLDVSALAPGEYELLCSIPGHEEAGMTATLTVGAEGGTSGDAAGSGADASHASHMSEADYQRMDEAMQSSISEFPADTEGVGNELLEPTVLDDGTKEFELTAAITPWEIAPGDVVDAWTYNGMAPGLLLRLDVGDQARIVLHNELPMGTDLHLHGIDVANGMDGVAPITQPLIESGESFTYEFSADDPVVAMYHAHNHAQLQVPNGMFGVILVGQVALPKGRTISSEAIPDDLTVAQELPMVLNDSGVIGYSLNGKSFPATAPIVAAKGDWILIHYYNEGGQIHPMHLHQFDQVVVAKDGFALDQPYLADTVNVAPGERYSVLVHLDSPGTWVWHCHILPHVERETGMFGMVTAVVVEDE
jgi:FtsP/CotA-like multicopper oxidase with cupredoxin domain